MKSSVQRRIGSAITYLLAISSNVAAARGEREIVDRFASMTVSCVPILAAENVSMPWRAH